EQLVRSRAADRQSRGWRVELCEIFREDRQRRSGDPLVEANETLDVSSDDAGGNEVHGVLLKLTLMRMSSRRDLFWIADIRRPHQAAPASSSKYARSVRGSLPRIARSVSALPSRLCRSYQSNIGFIAVSCRPSGESAGTAVEASSCTFAASIGRPSTSPISAATSLRFSVPSAQSSKVPKVRRSSVKAIAATSATSR